MHFIKVRDSELKDESVLDEFYDKVIQNYYYPVKLSYAFNASGI